MKDRIPWFVAPAALGVAVFALLLGLFSGGGQPEGLEGITNFDSIQLGNGLYPVGVATDGQQFVYGTDDITGTLEVETGLTTVTFAMCNLGEDPAATAGAGAHCTVDVAANVVTVNVWQDDFVTAATETDVAVHWIAVGEP